MSDRQKRLMKEREILEEFIRKHSSMCLHLYSHTAKELRNAEYELEQVKIEMSIPQFTFPVTSVGLVKDEDPKNIVDEKPYVPIKVEDLKPLTEEMKKHILENPLGPTYAGEDFKNE